MTEKNQELQSIEEELVANDRRKAELLLRQSQLLNMRQPSVVPSISPLERNALTTQQKIELFTKLFHGREDIYALRWENKQGRSGYSVPAPMSGRQVSVINPG
jgi:hypothetical protein